MVKDNHIIGSALNNKLDVTPVWENKYISFFKTVTLFFNRKERSNEPLSDIKHFNIGPQMSASLSCKSTWFSLSSSHWNKCQPGKFS